MGLRSGAFLGVMLATLAVCVPPAGAQSETRPWAYVSPFYQPKSNTSATLQFTNGDEAVAGVNLRRYDAVGGLMSSTSFNVPPKGTIISFAGANSGAQMHVEAWADSPAVIVEMVFTDTADATQRIDSSRWRVVGPERTLPGAVAGLQATMGELRPPILALSGQFDTVAGKLDSLQAGVNGLGGPVTGVAPQIQALATENAALRKDVTRLRRDLRALRKLIVRRLPRRTARAR